MDMEASNVSTLSRRINILLYTDCQSSRTAAAIARQVNFAQITCFSKDSPQYVSLKRISARQTRFICLVFVGKVSTNDNTCLFLFVTSALTYAPPSLPLPASSHPLQHF